MNGYQSPRTPGSTPGHEWDYVSRMSATPTPSPRSNWTDAQLPPRAATRVGGHSRINSYSSQSTFSPRPPRDSPRYNSSGEYATVDVSHIDFSSWSHPKSPHDRSNKPARRSSHSSHARSSTPYGESDEDEIIEAMGRTYVLPAQSRSRSCRYTNPPQPDANGVRYTNLDGYWQGAPHYADNTVYSRHPSYDMPRPIAQPRPPTSLGNTHHRRASNVPQRPSTTRPVSKEVPRNNIKTQGIPQATEEDAREHKIPAGYSLKHWDPRQPPILLLGSVFDANSLGKWIYDWTVYSLGAHAAIAEMAGELWLLILDLSEKTERAFKGLKARTKENRETVADYLDSSERLMAMFRLLLRNCEQPMLKTTSKKKQALGKNSGIEFVDTMFGRDRELPRTEKFMQKVRTWSMRFDANVVPILDNPSA